MAEAIVRMFARFGRSAPTDERAFAELVEELTAMYLRLLGLDDHSRGRV